MRPVRYDRASDKLTVILGPRLEDVHEYQAGGISAFINSEGTLAKIVIAEPGEFIRQALSAGVEVAGAPELEPRELEVPWYGADSSMISAYSYDESKSMLEIAYSGTGVYRYYGVPKDIFEGLQQASSKGRYIHEHIINVYPYEKKGRRRRG